MGAVPTLPMLSGQVPQAPSARPIASVQWYKTVEITPRTSCWKSCRQLISPIVDGIRHKKRLYTGYAVTLDEIDEQLTVTTRQLDEIERLLQEKWSNLEPAHIHEAIDIIFDIPPADDDFVSFETFDPEDSKRARLVRRYPFAGDAFYEDFFHSLENVSEEIVKLFRFDFSQARARIIATSPPTKLTDEQWRLQYWLSGPQQAHIPPVYRQAFIEHCQNKEESCQEELARQLLRIENRIIQDRGVAGESLWEDIDRLLHPGDNLRWHKHYRSRQSWPTPADALKEYLGEVSALFPELVSLIDHEAKRVTGPKAILFQFQNAYLITNQQIQGALEYAQSVPLEDGERAQLLEAIEKAKERWGRKDEPQRIRQSQWLDRAPSWASRGLRGLAAVANRFMGVQSILTSTNEQSVAQLSCESDVFLEVPQMQMPSQSVSLRETAE